MSQYQRRSYHRHLPHQIPNGVPVFLTWNLKGSLPKSAIAAVDQERLRLEGQPRIASESELQRKIRISKLLFAEGDNVLGESCKAFEETQPLVRHSGLTEQLTDDDRRGLHEPPVRLESLTYDGRPMWLADPRASQIVVDSILWGAADRYELYAWVVLGNHVHVLIKPLLPLHKITQSLKGYSAYSINRLHQVHRRVFWQDESYDHWVRDEEELFRIIEYIENNPVAAGLCVNQDDWVYSSARLRTERNWERGDVWC